MNAWAEHVGDESYKWEHMVKYLRRSPNFQQNHRRKNQQSGSQVTVRGEGPLKVALPAFVNPLSSYGHEAFSSIGLYDRPTLTSGSLDGVGWWYFTIDPESGLRSSAESSFLAEALSRADSNLVLYIATQARSILFEDKKAVGVVAATDRDDRSFTLKARREVLVAAGPYHSPQLLMVSGIGDKKVLGPLEIPVVSHLPGVGQNMRDSCYLAGPVYEVATPGPSYWREPNRLANATKQFLLNATGPLTSIGVDLAVWDLLPMESRSRLSRDSQDLLNKLPRDWPLIEYSLSSVNRAFRPTDFDKHYGTIDCVLVATSSKGNMTINSGSNFDAPVINPNWLQDAMDQEIALEAYRRARKAWEAIPDGIRLGEEVFPGANVTTDADLLQAIRSVLAPIYHASSSCKSQAWTIETSECYRLMSTILQVPWESPAIPMLLSTPRDGCMECKGFE